QQANWWKWRTAALHQKCNAHPHAQRKSHAGAALQQMGVDFGAGHSSGILGTYVLAAKAIRSAQGDLREAKEYVEMRAVTRQDEESPLAKGPIGTTGISVGS